MKLPDDVQEFFRKHGATGGKKRAEGMSPDERRASARNAARARWAKVESEKLSTSSAKKKRTRGGPK